MSDITCPKCGSGFIATDGTCLACWGYGEPTTTKKHITNLETELQEARAEVAELKRLLKWAWDNAIGRLESEERDEGFVCRLLQFPDGPERNAIEKIVGEK